MNQRWSNPAVTTPNIIPWWSGITANIRFYLHFWISVHIILYQWSAALNVFASFILNECFSTIDYIKVSPVTQYLRSILSASYSSSAPKRKAEKIYWLNLVDTDFFILNTNHPVCLNFGTGVSPEDRGRSCRRALTSSLFRFDPGKIWTRDIDICIILNVISLGLGWNFSTLVDDVAQEKWQSRASSPFRTRKCLGWNQMLCNIIPFSLGMLKISRVSLAVSDWELCC